MIATITVDGVDVTADVDIATARFSSQVNGSPGNCVIRVRDDGHTYEFISGGEVTLDIGSTRVWGGYLTRAQRVYPFPYQDTTDPNTTERYWQLQGVDYNILFQKRIVFDAGDPADHISFSYPVGTFDDEIIEDIFDNYLDLSSDGLSRAGVAQVDVVTLDIPGVTSGKGALAAGNSMVASAGFTWKQTMDTIARATGAVYYIDPEKVLHYVDVDTADASQGLSDDPGFGQVGYANFNLLFNGSNLVNDMLVWGSAAGSENIVFSRAQDATSQTAHGRWQGGLFTGGLYKQVSADLVSSSYLNGSPQSKRGGKDDAVTLRCRVFEPIFNVGQKVDTEVNIFDYQDVLPIRRMDIRFVNPDEPIFELSLSHDIDQPWSIFEQLFPPFNFQGIKPIRIDPIFPPIIIDGTCTPALCGITDSFNRIDQTDFGTSDAGMEWSHPAGSGTSTKAILDLQGQLLIPDQASAASVNARLPIVPQPFIDFDMTVELTFSFDDGTLAILNGAPTVVVGWGTAAFFRIRGPQTLDTNGQLDLDNISSFASADSLDFDVDQISGVPHVLHWQRFNNGADQRANFWPASEGEPVGWMLETTSIEGGPLTRLDFSLSGQRVSGPTTLETELLVNRLDIDGVNRCELNAFDIFGRTVVSGWGTASSGADWDTSEPAGTNASVSGDGILSSEDSNSLYAQAPLPFATGSAFEMFASWSVDSVPNFGGGEDLTLLEFGFWDNPLPTATLRFNIGIQICNVSINGGGFGSVYINDPGGETRDNSFSFTAGIYRTRIVCDGSAFIQAKVWRAEDPEPEDWTVERTVPSDAADEIVVAWSNSAGVAGDRAVNVQYIDFDYVGKPCFYDADGNPVGGVETVGPPSSGRVCETPVNLGGGVYKLTNAFIAGSAQVEINGLRWRRGGLLDYVEDPPNGEIIFNGPEIPEDDDEIVVCYRSNGAL